MSNTTIKGKAPYLSPLIGFKNENSRGFIKDLFAASLNYRLFLAKQHLNKDFLQRFTYGLFCRDSA